MVIRNVMVSNYVDRDEEEGGTLNRYKKDSFYWYQDVIKTDGENFYISKKILVLLVLLF